jgi:hypothetical protein
MNMLKTLVLTALAAATVGTGALAAAPSASAATATNTTHQAPAEPAYFCIAVFGRVVCVPVGG